MKKRLSVIVGVYNTPSEKLKRCIDSIINQTYQNLEIILIDDGSINDAGNLCDLYAEKDKRIRVIHQKNYGTHAKFEIGYKLVQGDYVTNVDHDDYLELDYYEQMMQIANERDIDVVDSGYFHHNWRTDSIEKKYVSASIEIVGEKEIVERASNAEVAVDTWCYIFKTALAKRDRDWDLINDLSFRGAKSLVHIPYAGYHFCNFKGTTSSGRLNSWYLGQVEKFFSEEKIKYTLETYPFLDRYIVNGQNAWLNRCYFYMLCTKKPRTEKEKQLISKLKQYLRYDREIAKKLNGSSRVQYMLLTHKLLYFPYKILQIVRKRKGR